MRNIKNAFLLLLLPVLWASPKVTVVSFPELQSYAQNKTNDTLYVVNFWATWCDQCVKEMPAFLQESKNESHKKVKFIFVSLNAVRELSTVQKFADKNKMPAGRADGEPTILLLNGGNPNNWIDKIDSSWGGSIPATIMYKSGKKSYFREGEFTLESLDKIIQSILK